MVSNKHGRERIDEHTELFQPQLPILTRAWYFIQLWGLKIAIVLTFRILRFLRPAPPEAQPTKLLAYPCRPNLRTRIFSPTFKQADDEPLPLYLDLHGGGHALMFAEFDDEICATIANRFNIIVVGIEYSLTPSNRFPVLTDDIVAIAQATIDNPDLNIDKSRVVLGGFTWYPVMDFTLTPDEKKASRPYRHAKDLDDLPDFGPVFEWGHIPPGQNLRDPLLSTRFVRKDDVPKWIYIIGAEYDMLAKEARDTAFDLAELNEHERKEGVYGFEKDSYKWTLVRDVRHGFTHDLMDNKGPDAEAIRKLRTDEVLEQLVLTFVFDESKTTASAKLSGLKVESSSLVRFKKRSGTGTLTGTFKQRIRRKAMNTLTDATMTGTTTAELKLFEPEGFAGGEVSVVEAGTSVEVAMERISAIIKAYCEAKTEDENNARCRIVRRWFFLPDCTA
ncbi:hypothetical protein DID88_008703 [Monilinia fructigena]|uniref:Alpha/beta hydrolase fold-3 domain-containing protein n=1 Tax=Monilinia fructigena TaxID=38457 RepID=A0A395JB74_9HELO|nr:hypothetical protein DID88_008703 [Monilinia fructigena]